MPGSEGGTTFWIPQQSVRACIVHKVFHPLAKRAESIRSRVRRVGLSHGGNKGVWVWRKRLGKYVNLEKPDNVKIKEGNPEWIVREKRKGDLTNAEIAGSMGVTVRRVRQPWSRYGRVPDHKVPSRQPRRGRPVGGMYGRRELSAVPWAARASPLGSVGLQRIIGSHTGIHISNGTIRRILMNAGLAESHPKKGKGRKWIRYEREHSNSPWHTDRKRLDDGRWFPAYGDGASGFVTGYGVFGNPTAENAPRVPDGAIGNHGKPAAVMTDHGPQFYANEKEAAKRGASGFGKRPVEPGIRQILAGVRHPQTNGKPERPHGGIRRKLPRFGSIMMGDRRSNRSVHGMVRLWPPAHVAELGRTGDARTGL